MVIRHREIRLGAKAVEKGLITAAQLGKAVSMQMKEDLLGEKRRLIGEILVEMGFMNQLQIEEVLQAQRNKKEVDLYDETPR
ncbi:hypothetical protein KJ965_05435 [Patescibacteria group bacterium]|nr:hypothetical protein [Pseudomonadota bacterium]MBU1932109.1 hypothetical protein [Patescibacteria group bacterium]